MFTLVLLTAALAAWLHRQGVIPWTMAGADDVELKVCEAVEPFVLSPTPVCQAALHKLANATEILRRHRETVSEGYARVLQESSQWLEIARELQNGRRPVLVNDAEEELVLAAGVQSVAETSTSKLDARITQVEEQLVQLDRTEANGVEPASDITPPTRDRDFDCQLDARIETLEKELAELDARASMLFTRGVEELETQASGPDVQSRNVSTTPSQLTSATQLETWAAAAGGCPQGSEEWLLCEQASRSARAAMEALMKWRSAGLLEALS
jgi:hypothetical protein